MGMTAVEIANEWKDKYLKRIAALEGENERLRKAAEAVEASWFGDSELVPIDDAMAALVGALVLDRGAGE